MVHTVSMNRQTRSTGRVVEGRGDVLKLAQCQRGQGDHQQHDGDRGRCSGGQGEGDARGDEGEGRRAIASGDSASSRDAARGAHLQ
jgi:hypothetical protein